MTREHFKKARFLALEKGDTHGYGLPKCNLEQAFKSATYIGDKFPLLFRHFDYILKTFPHAKHIYIVRNPLSVVESYDARHQDKDDHWQKSWQTGLEDWNESVRTVMDLPKKLLSNFYFVTYEDFFASEEKMNALYRHFGLSELPAEQLTRFCQKFEELNERPVKRRDDMRKFVAMNAEWGPYRRLLRQVKAQETQAVKAAE